MSSDDDRCEMSDLPKDQCDHCVGKPTEPWSGLDMGEVFVARFKGTCVSCDEPIEPGDHIAVTEYVRDGTGQIIKGHYAHYGCMRS
jgi:hypothetical protein